MLKEIIKAQTVDEAGKETAVCALTYRAAGGEEEWTEKADE